MTSNLENYNARLKELEPIRHDYHAQKEKTIQTTVASIAGFSAFVFSQAEKVAKSEALVAIVFLIFACAVFLYTSTFLRKQIYLKRGAAAQYAAITTDLWKIANGEIKEEDIGLKGEEVQEFHNKYGLTDSEVIVKYWSKSYAETVKGAYGGHFLASDDRKIIWITTLMSILSILNFLLVWSSKYLVLDKLVGWVCGMQ